MPPAPRPVADFRGETGGGSEQPQHEQTETGIPPAVPSSAPPRTAATRLIIVRHGETSWNAEGRMQGQTDTVLTEKGQAQARSVAEALCQAGWGASIDAIVSSDLSRARETAVAIASSCPAATTLVEDSGLREVHAGSLQGLLIADSKAAKSSLAQQWSQGLLDAPYPGPGGESPSMAVTRGLKALRDAALLGSCVLVVSHGGIIRWCATAIELGVDKLKENISSPGAAWIAGAKMPNCCCSMVDYDHVSDTFRAERWFNALGSVDGLEDTG